MKFCKSCNSPIQVDRFVFLASTIDVSGKYCIACCCRIYIKNLTEFEAEIHLANLNMAES